MIFFVTVSMHELSYSRDDGDTDHKQRGISIATITFSLLHKVQLLHLCGAAPSHSCIKITSTHFKKGKKDGGRNETKNIMQEKHI